jgi:hypothetical protein
MGCFKSGEWNVSGKSRNSRICKYSEVIADKIKQILIVELTLPQYHYCGSVVYGSYCGK